MFYIVKGNANAYKILVGKPEVKISLARSRRRLKDSVKTGLKEIGPMEGFYEKNTVVNLGVP
jgi:hypothetical protein